MEDQIKVIIIGVSVGVAVGILAAICSFFLIKFYRRRSRIQRNLSEHGVSSIAIRSNASNASIDSSISLSVSENINDLEHVAKRNAFWGRRGLANKDPCASVSGIPRYSYKDIQKATMNFTTILGQGSFGPVYKAIMPTSELVAVKVLASNSKQGEREFQTEVALLSRLHHRNLVNLVGYCVDKAQSILVYEYMSNGSLAGLLYGDNQRILSWEERFQIALDISHGIEYLHDGAVPSVVHRDLKSANILLDNSLRAKVADFGLSKEDVYDGRKSGLKGTYGYMDPDYVSTNKFTKKSDIYSLGIILFELITAINPQQGLMEYINLAAIGSDGKVDWDEIIDKNLLEEGNPEEVRLLADVAHRCLHKVPRKRPSISDVTQFISRIRQRRFEKKDTTTMSRNDASGVLRRIELQQVELSNMTSMKANATPLV